jgi:hypothetical protein
MRVQGYDFDERLSQNEIRDCRVFSVRAINRRERQQGCSVLIYSLHF